MSTIHTRQTRRTRFVCVSDTHNTYPKLPPGDVLVHAGDLTNSGSLSELTRTVEWLERADFEVKIVIAGNHDVTLDDAFYTEHGAYFHHKDVQNHADCLALLTRSPSIIYLNHEAKGVQLTKAGGPGTIFKVFGSPYSPSRGFWAFGYAPENAATLWDKVPLDTDVLITHTPPKFHCDESGTRGSAGCPDLREALWRVRPLLAICGHIHEARGVETVHWDLSTPNVKFKELGTNSFVDDTVDSRKHFRVDLTARSRTPLKNTRSYGVLSFDVRGTELLVGGDGADDGEVQLETRLAPVSLFPGQETAQRPISNYPDHEPRLTNATRGQGGVISSTRCDQEALVDREGCLETCIVNASILASNWPHKSGKKFHKPIIIDVDLPIATDVDGW